MKPRSDGHDFIADAIAHWETAGYRHLRKDLLGRFEREFISQLLRLSDNNVSKAAAMAKIDRKHFWRLMERNGIRRPH